MRAAVFRRGGMDLDRRLDTLRVAANRAQGRLRDEDLAALRRLLTRAGARLGLGTELTVAALAGPTGSGKSSLFNALAGSEVAEVGVRRPTTSVAHACVWGDVHADELLDWLEISRRHRTADEELDGLVLLDLPDLDSTDGEHRLEGDRLIELVDLFVWVVDPQKYADAVLHDAYLRPLATHAPVSVLVLNHADRLTQEERRKCAADLRRLLEADGMRGVAVLTTSARTGEGVEELRRIMADRVLTRRAAVERLRADVNAIVVDLSRFCGGEPRSVKGKEHGTLIATLADAAGVGTVTDAIARSHRRDAALVTGWPITRWLRRLKPDPLRRLHLSGSTGGATSLPDVSPARRASVESAVRSMVRTGTAGMPEPWPTVVQQSAGNATDGLLEDLDRTVAETDLGGRRRPRWWGPAGALQLFLLMAAVVGFLWLALLFALEWLQIPRPPVPRVGEAVPVPTLLLAGGLFLGFALGALFAIFARMGATRRSRRAHKRLLHAVEITAGDRLVGSIDSELQAYRDFCAALASIK